MKKGKRSLALLLISSIIMSVAPISTYAEEITTMPSEDVQEETSNATEEPLLPSVLEPVLPPVEEPEELKQPEPSEPFVREPQDFTGNREELEIAVYGATYQEEGQAEVVVDADQSAKKLDLTEISAEHLQLDISIRALRERELRKIRGNDTFQFTIPETYFSMENTQAPILVYNSMQQDVKASIDLQVAEYTVENNVVTVTIHPNVEAESTEYVLAALHLQGTIKKEALDISKTTEVAIEGTEYQILLKGSPKEESEEAIKPGEKEEPTTDKEPVKAPAVEEKEKDKVKEPVEQEGLLPKIRVAFSGFLNVFAGEEKAAKDLATAYEFSKAKDKLPEGFNSIKLAVVSKEGGYKKEDLDSKVRFDISTFMDEEELYPMSEMLISNYADFPQGPEDNANQWIKNIDQWRRKNPGILPDYTFSYDLGEYFQEQADVNKKLTLTRNGQDINIGSYKIANGVLTISVHPVCSFMDNVYFRESIEVSLNKDKLSDKLIEVVIGEDGKLVFQLEGTAGGGSDEPEDAKYEVKKEGPVKVTGTSIEYQVYVSALQEGQMLNGKTLADRIPEGLEVTKAWVVLNGTTEEQVKGEDGKPSGSYTFKPYAESEGNQITSAAFTFVMELTPEKYQDYIKNGIDTTFKNKAELSGEDLADKKVVSEEVSTKMSAKFINKSGKSENVEGTKYTWNIQLNTKLSSMKDGYLVDTICETDHQYDFTKGIEVQTKGEKALIEDFVNLGSGLSWKELTVEKIRGLVPNSEFNQKKAFYYTVDDTGSDGNKILNPFYGVADEPEYKQRTILIIPYKGLQGTEASKSVNVRYATALNMHGLDAQNYWDKIEAGLAKPAIENHVNLLWDNEGGRGPTSVSQDDVNFGKTVDTYPGAVVKKGANYNPATQKLTWNVEVNKLGSDMKNVVLTDELASGQYDITDELDIQWYNYRSVGGGLQESDKLKKGEANKDSKGRYYELVPKADKTLVKIYLGNVGPVADSVAVYDFYKLQFSLKLTDPDILAIQKADHKKQNTIKMEAEIGGNPKEHEDTGEQLTPNVLIEKEAVATYNYATFELPWKVTINPNKLAIKDAKVTDTILSEFVFGKVTKVEKNGVEDTTMLGKIKDENSEGSSGPAVFTLGDIQDTYTVYFTTKTTEGWRDTHLKTGNGTQASVDVRNEAKLDGTIYNKPIEASDDATHKIGKAPLGKSGNYNKEKGTITWTVDINKEHFNVSGLKMVEELTKSQEPAIHELDPDTIKIWQVKTSAAGEETLVPVPATDDQFGVIGANEFTYVFPDVSADNSEKNYEYYRFEFTTNLTAEAEGVKITNKIYLKDGSDNNINESGNSDGGYGGDHKFDKDIHAQGRPRVILRKISENSQSTTDNDKNLGLDGVTFSLEVCKFTVNEGDKKLIIEDPVYKYGKVRISEDGEAYFPNIKTSTQDVTDESNLVCVLKEDSPAEGYANNAAPHFIYFASTRGDLIHDNVRSIAYDSKDYTPGTDAFYQYKEIKEDGTTEGASVVMKNEPKPSTFSFNKQQVKLDSYKNESGTIAFDNENAAGVQFKGTPLDDDSAGKLKPFDVVSDDSGNVIIENLDAGTYLLTETHPTAGHKPGTVKLKVIWNKGTAAYDYAFVPGSATGGIKLINGGADLHNQLNTGKVEFTKYAKYQDGAGDQITEGSSNREVLSGAQFRLKNSSSAFGPNKVEMTAISDTDGKVAFDGLPLGEYDIYEVYGNDAVPGYEIIGAEEKVYHVKVTEDITKETRPVTVELIKERPEDSDKHINNTPIKGTIEFMKKSKDAQLSALDDKTLEGAEFGLYRKIDTATAKKALYTDTSDAAGNVEFSGVEYGDYVLKETKAPAGYKPMSDVTITKEQIKDQVGLDPGDTIFSYKTGDASHVIVNETLKANVPLIKKDKDKTGMAGVQFLIFRRGDAQIGTNGENLVLGVPEAATDFYEYGPLTSVTSGADGTMNLSGLPYGDYLLVEDTSGLELQEGANKVAVLVSVSGGQTTGEATVKISGSDNAALVDAATLKGYTDVDTSSFLPYTDKDSDKVMIVNQRKYGYINLNKAAGQKENSDAATLLPYPNERNPQYIKGATFEISKKKSDGTYEKYLTLQTNAKGQFDVSKEEDTKGAYKDIEHNTYKHLWYGEYKIKESKALDGFEMTVKETMFTIGDAGSGYAGHEGTTWISFDGTNDNVSYVKKEETTPAGILYLNGICRGGFFVTKTETGTTKKLSGAEFVVLTKDGTEVAALKESTSLKGKYILTDQKFGGGVYNQTNALAIPYLHLVGGMQQLLAGKYVIKETKAPAGYTLLSTGKEVMVVNGQISNEVEIENEPFAISITKKSIDSSVTEELTGVHFVLEGAFADTKAEKKSLTDSNKGDVSGLIVGESYSLTEVKAPVGYCKYSGKVTFKIASDGTIQNLRAPGEVTNQITAAGTDITFKNVPNELTLEKRATDVLPGVTGDGNLLNGAEFTITNKDNAADTMVVPVIGGRVSVKGKLTGGATYVLRETKVPADYAVNTNSITFTMGEDGKVIGSGLSENKITVYNDPIRLVFTKVGKYNESCADVDAGAVRPLEGVTFGVYAASSPDILIERAVSDEAGKVTFSKLPKNTYIVRELSTVQGYKTDDTEYYAQIDDYRFEGLKVRDEDGTLSFLKDNKVINDVFRADIVFTKVSEKDTDKVLPGSEYGLYKYKSEEPLRKGLRSLWAMFTNKMDEQELILVATAVTDEIGVLKFPGVLINTEYVVKELRAPDGSYVSKNPMKITFGTEVDETGQIKIKVVSIDDGSGTVKVDPDTGEIIWLEPEVEVSFLKKTTEGTMLEGASLELQDEQGTVIEEWTSKQEAHVISGKLIIGSTYRLVEKAAPNGYQIAEPVEFTIENEEIGPNQKKVQEVIMVDQRIGESKTNPSGNEDPKGVGSIKTGDTKAIMLWLLLFLAAAGTTVCIIRKKRNSNCN